MEKHSICLSVLKTYPVYCQLCIANHPKINSRKLFQDYSLGMDLQYLNGEIHGLVLVIYFLKHLQPLFNLCLQPLFNLCLRDFIPCSFPCSRIESKGLYQLFLLCSSSFILTPLPPPHLWQFFSAHSCVSWWHHLASKDSLDKHTP